MNDESDRKAKEQAQRDLDAISVLKKSEHFNGYFVRRVGDRVRELEGKLKYRSDAELLGESITREGVRQRIIALEEMLKVLPQDEAVCRRQVERGDLRVSQ